MHRLPNEESGPLGPPASTGISASLGLIAAWLAAGALGPLDSLLQLTVVFGCIVAAYLLERPRGVLAWSVLGGVILVGHIFVRYYEHAGALLVALAVAALADGCQSRRDRRLQVVAWSIFGFTITRMLLLTAPLSSNVVNTIAAVTSRAVGQVVGVQLSINAAMGGFDYVILVAFLAIGLAWAAEDRAMKLVWNLATVVVGHIGYLVALSLVTVWARRIPPITLPEFGDPYVPPPFQWIKLAHWAVPWLLPALALVIHTAVAAVLLRSATGQPGSAPRPADIQRRTEPSRRWRAEWLVAVCVLLLPMVTNLHPQKLGIAGKSLAAFEYGDLDWNVPGHGVYGQQAAGFFGMLPALAQSLGGEFFLTPDMAEPDLKAADVLLILNPDERLTEPMQRRVWQYVRDGGALLVAAHGYYPRPADADVVNRLLAPTSIRVRQDAAVSRTGDWQIGYDRTTHPAFAAWSDVAGPVLSGTGASLRCGVAAWPILSGRWGWSAPEIDAPWNNATSFTSADQIGGLTLAAEQRVGKGRVIVLGDSNLLSNEQLVHSWPVIANTLGYLAQRASAPQLFWRQAMALLAGLALVVLLAGHQCRPRRLVVAAVGLVAVLLATQLVNRRAVRLAPNGDWIGVENRLPGRTNRLAYIDAGHLGVFSWQNWGFDALNGLALTLMRSDYLPLMTPRITAAQLAHAGMLVVPAPGRSYSARERHAIEAFVQRGGILICTIGAEEARTGNRLLADYGVYVPATPVAPGDTTREPAPIGRITLPYFVGQRPDGSEYTADVSFWAAWPLALRAKATDVDVLVQDTRGQPIILSRQFGRGAIVVIGDTYFATNKNLEYATGEPFGGRYDNANFWRWLLSRLTERQGWVPPPVDEAAPAAADQEGSN